MESRKEEVIKTIDNKYEILKTIDEGGFGKVYKVKDFITGKIYAAKIPLKSQPKYEDVLDNEFNMLIKAQNPNLIEKGEGYKSKNGRLSRNKIKYLIMKFAGKGDLSQYIQKINKNFSEKYAKVIFRKILKGVLECHKRGICHRDLKLENILLDDQFNPIIADFGLATLIQRDDGNRKLRGFQGTMEYVAPEILLNEEYDGIKADIFSLGVILCFIVTQKQFYNPKIPREKNVVVFNPQYNNLRCGFLKKFFSSMQETSKEFKDLFLKMISYKPVNRISSIEEILNDPWFKEIRELNDEELKKLETEIYTDFLEREEKINEFAEKFKIINETDDEEYCSRGVNDKEYFSSNLNLSKLKTGINMKDFIKIEGMINPYKFMNEFANNIEKENNCSIEVDEKTYKFLVDFEMEEENEEITEELLQDEKKLNIEEENEEKKDENEDEDEDEDEKYEEMKKYNSLSIQMKLFKSDNNDYFLRFVKKGGRMYDYIKKLIKMKEIIRKLLL